MKFKLNKPPILAKWLLKHLNIYQSKFGITGDLEEVFYDISEQRGYLAAYLWFWFHTILTIPQYVTVIFLRQSILIRSYLKSSIRVIKKQRGYAYINIFGLSIGICCSILIFSWVTDELSFDNFHDNNEQLFRIVVKSGTSDYPVTAGALGPVLVQQVPEIISTSRLFPNNPALIRKENINFYEQYRYVDKTFFDLFTFKIISGDKKSFFSEPSSAVITEDIAKKFFGDENPIGQELIFNTQTTLTISGVIENPPENSHIEYSILLPVENNLPDRFMGWEMEVWCTYVLVEKDSDIDALNTKINSINKNRIPETESEMYLQEISDIYLYSNGFQYDTIKNGDIKYVQIFSAIGIIVLFIACINFINLSTARSSIRVTEIGIRKLSGASRKGIILQFFVETLLICGLSFGIAIALFFAILPFYYSISGKILNISNITIENLGIYSVTIFITVAIAGIFPAIILSSYEPSKVLKGILETGNAQKLFRKSMVVFQFVMAIFMVAGSLIIRTQLMYISNKDLGFKSENIVYFPMRSEMGNKYETVRNRLLQNPEITDVTLGFVPVTIGSWTEPYWEGKDSRNRTYMYRASVDYNLLDFYEMEMVAGRYFDSKIPTDTLNYVVNEAAVAAMGIASPVGKRFSIKNNVGKIIGVVKNFHYRSIHNPIEPFIFVMNPSELYHMSVRINSRDHGKAINSIKLLWDEYTPDYPFEYNILTDFLAKNYRKEQRLGTLFNYFTFLSILISCVGLLGLVSFMVEQRTKEIGIRKVLGASIRDILKLLSKDYLASLLMSCIIAWPLVWYFMNEWLQNFAFRTEIKSSSFIGSGFLMLALLGTVVAFYARRAAISPPVKALRYE